MPESAKFTANPKVVHLEPESHRIARSRIARLPAPVHAVHEKGKQILLQYLRVFFDRADDSLFELADKASTNQEQNLFFDSMREVRVQRMGVEKRFSEAIDAAFSALLTPNGEQRPNAYDETLSADALSLVQNDDLEEMVAIDSAVAKALRENGEAIQHISLRLDSLVPVKVYEKNNPLGPDVLCNAFMGQIKRLDVGIKAKLVLFKLFDNAVVNKLDDLYREVNQTLINHNVLPSMTGAARGHSGGRPGQGSNAQAPSNNAGFSGSEVGGNDAGVNSDVLAALQSILHQAPNANQAIAPEVNTLLHLLSVGQRMPATEAQPSQRVNVPELLVSLQQQLGVDASIGRVNEEVINLVNMLFDFILEDRNLAPPMKSLISRMQIPIVKVALVDKSFFTKGGHIARRLLNEMATAAIGWQGDPKSKKRDPLYQKIEDIVRTLVNDFDTNVEIFSELLTEFTAFLEKEKRRIAVMEQRTLDAEDGKAKAEVARTTVAIEIELRTIDMPLPEIVNTMISEVWSNVLFVSGLKYGYSSKEWNANLVTLEQLVWSVQPPKTTEARQRLIRAVPSLLKKLRSGFDVISYNPFEMSNLFKQLEEVHLACIRGKPFAATVNGANQRPGQQASNESVSSDASPQISQNEELRKDVGSEVNRSSVKPGSTRASASAELQKLREENNQQTSKTAAQKTVMEEPVTSFDDDLESVLAEESLSSSERIKASKPLSKPASNREKEEVRAPQVKSELQKDSHTANTTTSSSASEPTELPENDPHMQQVKQFVQGAWFDFRNDDGSASRCRLAAFIKPTGKYIFVNRNGMKVAEKSQQELALALKEQKLLAMDNSMLFDRALETVVTSLRKN